MGIDHCLSLQDVLNARINLPAFQCNLGIQEPSTQPGRIAVLRPGRSKAPRPEAAKQHQPSVDANLPKSNTTAAAKRASGDDAKFHSE